MFGYNFYREVIKTKKGTIILIDVADTFDAGIEGAYCIFDEEAFKRAWEQYCEDEENQEYTFEDIKNYAEEFDAFDDWIIVSSHHRSVDAALKNVMKAIKAI